MPKPDRNLTGFEVAVPHAAVHAEGRAQQHLLMLESRVLGFAIHPSLMKNVQKLALRHIRKQIPDPELRKTVTPNYTLGCKRVLISNDYYPALSRKNVDVITTGIDHIEADAVVTTDGKRHEVDCLIYGTGFQVADPYPRGAIIGRGGLDIVDAWRDGAHAYLGSTLPGYPNFFMIVGPNTGLGHNSMVFMIESQIEYILGALQAMRRERADALEVRPLVEAQFNSDLQGKLKKAIWSTGGCKSWYLDPRTGKNTTWPGFTWRFRQATAHFDRRLPRVSRAATRHHCAACRRAAASASTSPSAEAA